MLGFRVPVDDHSHVTYTVTHAHVSDDKRVDFITHRKAEG
jgi:hypothetical protein